MAIPTPEPGLVIAYAYLWHHEHLGGHEEGRKDGPSVIVLATQGEDGAEVIVLPITHRAPADPAWAVEIPPQSSGTSASTMHARGSSSLKAMNSSGRAMTFERLPAPTATILGSPHDFYKTAR